ncbi:MAG: hypothetical protein ACI83P_002426 [Janthinobacterium sp.]|jgi:hypothetical protein
MGHKAIGHDTTQERIVAQCAAIFYSDPYPLAGALGQFKRSRHLIWYKQKRLVHDKITENYFAPIMSIQFAGLENSSGRSAALACVFQAICR